MKLNHFFFKRRFCILFVSFLFSWLAAYSDNHQWNSFNLTNGSVKLTNIKSTSGDKTKANDIFNGKPFSVDFLCKIEDYNRTSSDKREDRELISIGASEETNNKLAINIRYECDDKIAGSSDKRTYLQMVIGGEDINVNTCNGQNYYAHADDLLSYSWHHYAIVSDGFTTKLYLDGHLAITTGILANITLDQICIGNNYSTQTKASYQNFRVWGSALRDIDVAYIQDKFYTTSSSMLINLVYQDDHFVQEGGLYNDCDINLSGISSTSSMLSLSPPWVTDDKLVTKNDGFKLSWQGHDDFKYTVQYRLVADNSSPWIDVVTGLTDTEYEVEQALGEKRQYQILSSWITDSEEKKSGNDFVLLPRSGTTGTTGITAPTNLRVTDDVYGDGESTLTWDFQDDFHHFEVTLPDGSDTVVLEASCDFKVPDLLTNSSNTTFSVKTSQDGEINPNNKYESSVVTSVPITLDNARVKEAPKDVVSESDGFNMLVSWSYNTNAYPQATNFLVYRSDPNDPTEFEMIDTVEVFDFSYVDRDAGACINYSYKVCADNDAGHEKSASSSESESSMINDFDFSTLFPDERNVFSASKGYYSNMISLQWEPDPDIAGSVKEYNIYRRIYNIGEFEPLVQPVSGSRSYDDTNVDAGVEYEYKIWATSTCNGDSSNVLTTSGYRLGKGIVTGRIQYEGGNAVKGAKIKLDSDIEQQRTAITTSRTEAGTVFNMVYSLSELSVDIAKGFTFETYLKAQERFEAFEPFQGISLKMSGSRAYMTLESCDENGANSVSRDFMSPVNVESNAWHHYAFTLKADTMSGVAKSFLSFSIDGVSVSDTVFIPKSVVRGILDSKGVTLGSHAISLDELRIYNCVRSNEEIVADYDCYLSGDEDGLVTYLRFDEDKGAAAYDLSHVGRDYYMNDWYFSQEDSLYEWSSDVPSKEKLNLYAITDSLGNYRLEDIPYQGSGQLYEVIPVLGVHRFDPVLIDVYLGDNSQVQNQIDFDDLSSFTFTGEVVYSNADDQPVSGVSILVDGLAVIGDDGFVTSDENGEFSISVPIGEHTLTVEKEGHTFIEAQWPFKTATDSSGVHDFQDHVYNVEFQDTTTRIFAGRISGGEVQYNVPLGFGESESLVGEYIIKLAAADDNLTMDYSIATDPLSGEFEQRVIPEVFSLVSVEGNTDYLISTDGESLLDFSAAVDTLWSYLTEEMTDSDGSVLLDTAGYALLDTIDSYPYHLAKKWSVKTDMQVEISNGDDESFLGEEELQIGDHTVAVYDDNGEPEFGHPIFQMYGSYILKARVYKEFVNHSTHDTVQIAVPNAEVYITNALSLVSSEQSFISGDDGIVRDSFIVGYPNLMTDNTNPENNFTKNINLRVEKSGDDTYTWTPNNETYRGIVLGTKRTGNDFVTMGPDEVKFILRDPPGSNSYASVEEGFTLERSAARTNSGGGFFDSQVMFKTGIGDNDVGVGVHIAAEINWGRTKSSTESVTLTQAYSTSESPDYVGAPGDVFFGTSKNLIYGMATELSLCSIDSCNKDLPFSKFLTSDSLTLGQNLTIGMGDSLTTTFVYTQHHIENALIPNLMTLRNNFFIAYPDVYSLDDSTIQQKMVLDTDDYSYTSGAHELDSVSFFQAQINAWVMNLAVNEFEKLVALDEYTTEQFEMIFESMDIDGVSMGIKVMVEEEKTKTHSYTYNDIGYNESTEKDKTVDGEVTYTSQTITLTIGEGTNKVETKIERPIDLREGLKDEGMDFGDVTFDDTNISFDAGASYSSSMSTSLETSVENTYSWGAAASFVVDANAGTGFFSTNSSLEIGVQYSFENVDTWSSSSETMVSYTLADEDAGDYYSVDVKKDAFGNGPIFVTRGGKSSCPYEGSVLSKYIKPNTLLSSATMRIEDPVLGIDQNTVSEVPSDEAAVYVLSVGNASEVGEDVWYELIVDVASNPDGAKIYMDGASINNGTSIYVPGGVTLKKTIELYKGAVDNYDNIKIQLNSLCDDMSSEVELFADFIPTCSPVELTSPSDNWVANSERMEIPIRIEGYNLQVDSLYKITYSYKKTSDANWTLVKTFFVDEDDYDDFGNVNKGLIIKSYILDTLDMSKFTETDYFLRANTYCRTDGSEDCSTNSEVLAGVVDFTLPTIFGVPQPSDGVLNSDDVISVKFNEDVIVDHSDITVRSRKNEDGDKQHEAFVDFDGTTQSVEVPVGVNLQQCSFAIDFCLKRNATGATKEVIYAQDGLNSLEIGMKNDRLYVLFGNDSLSISEDMTSTTGWYHCMVSHDIEDGKMYIYYAIGGSTVTCSSITNDKTFKVDKNIVIGNNLEKTAGLNGRLHGVNVWSEALENMPVGEVTGYESNLLAAWSMDDVVGAVVPEKVMSRNGILKANWAIDNDGRSVEVNDGYILIPTGLMQFNDESDFTVELWMNMPSRSSTQTIFSNGKPDSDSKGMWSVNLTPSGQLEILNDAVTESIDNTDLGDGMWHHLAIANKSIGNLVVYVDGVSVYSTSSSDFSGMYSSNFVLGATCELFEQSLLYSNNAVASFDELRIYNKYLEQSDVLETMNEELSGEEIGLKAYFPFQTYEGGLPVGSGSNQTMDDSGIADSIAMDLTYSESSPLLKSASQMVGVGFTYVVNGDELLITPTEDYLNLENQTIEISVDKVEDNNGNKQLSAMSWDAFVELNPLRWEKEELSIEMDVDEVYSFSVNLLNQGNANVYYSLESLPAWISVDDTDGKVTGLSSAEIEFNVNTAINVGDYQGTVVMATSDGYYERLDIELTVRTAAPDWTVDASQFENSMIIIGQLMIDNELSTDVADVVAAFNGDVCQGLGNVQYFSERDLYLVNMTIFGDLNTDDLQLRVWDASEGNLYNSVTPNVTYEENAIIGTPASPTIIATTDSVAIEIGIDVGWNWLSFNLESRQLENADLLFASLSSTGGDVVKTIDKHESFYTGGIIDDCWPGELAFSTSKMYKLKAGNAGVMQFSGVPVATSSTHISIVEGWNWIAYSPQVKMPVSSALAYHTPTQNDLIKSQNQFAMYDEFLGWIGSLTYMTPSEGYMYKSVNVDPVSFVYPQLTLFSKSASSEVDQAIDFVINEEFNMSAMIKTVNSPFSAFDDTKLIAMSGNEVVAESQVLNVQGDSYFAMTIGGHSDVYEMSFILVNESTGETLEANESMNYSPDVIAGTVRDPFEISFDVVMAEELVSVTPNPFGDLLIISNIPDDVDLVEIYDMQGHCVKTWSSFNTNSLEWNGHSDQGFSLPAGVYVLKMFGVSYIAPQVIIREE